MSRCFQRQARLRLVLACLLPLLTIGLLGAAPELPGCIQQLPLDASRPLYVPTHPRVSTTLRFPSAVEAPEGRGFTEDEGSQPGEYLVSWTRGDSHFTVVPLEGAGPLNLNVPYKGRTYVFYFYPADSQFHAVASLVCTDDNGRTGNSPQQTSPALPVPEPKLNTVPLTPARALGLIDRLKLIEACPEAQRTARAGELGLQLSSGVSTTVPVDYGLYELRPGLMCADERMQGVAFCVVLINRAPHAIAFDPSGFGARVDGAYLSSFCSDVPPVLAPGEESKAYFVVNETRGGALLNAKSWRLSAGLLSPNLDALGALVRKFAEAGREGER